MIYDRRRKRIFARRSLAARLVPRAKITGKRVYRPPAERSVSSRRLRLTPRALWGIAGLAVLLLLVLLLTVGRGKPAVRSLVPEKGALVSGSPLTVRVELKKGLPPDQVRLTVDGEDLTERAALGDGMLTLEAGLPDGEHRVEVTVKDKMEAYSNFVVDNTPPDLLVEGWDLRDDGITVISGRVEGASALYLEDRKVRFADDGTFNLEVNRNELTSVRLSAVDAAGNRREMVVDTAPPPQVKGVHVSIWVAANLDLFRKMVDLAKRTELNGLQIDIKDESGLVGYASQVPLAEEVNSHLKKGGVDIERVMDKCWYNDIYPIARIVCFKDPIVASKRKDLAVHARGGGLWGNGQWLDPYNREVWEYILGLAQEAARKGFKEIQLDYVRFPSDGDVTTCVFPADDGRGKEETLVEFLKYMREGLKPLGVVLSADVFGLTGSHQGTMGIGQDVTAMARYLDYLSPMVYPSHYNPGEYQIKDPESNPHDTVYMSLVDFQKKLEGTGCKLRPWLQDFSLRVTYGTSQVQAQMRACYELGIDEWLLWDPNCTYTEGALQPAE
ncbi:putative glycoside hydrolase [Candidatus Solincola tengchongensis]|uniref:putative glycoside hydrolase n=1 Tax=Candidatus Solincola tengchongensis TaxID=2900693 RepID=UPI002580775D|nr:putative glycoside hydrolase [Candidatus Solincola tengchongensis]